MRVELIYEVPHRRKSCRFGVDSDALQDKDEMDKLGDISSPHLILDAIRHLRSWALSKGERISADHTTKNMTLAVIMNAYWLPGVREMWLVEDRNETLVLKRYSKSVIEPPEQITLPPLDRIDVWKSARLRIT